MREIIQNGKPYSSPDVDNDVAVAYVPSNEHARTFLLGVRADYSAAVNLIRTLTLKVGPATTDALLGGSGLAAGSGDDTKLATGAFNYVIARAVAYLAATETALPSGTIPADTWGSYRVSINGAGTITITAAAANYTTGYASEGLALAAVPAVPADEADLGYFTVLTAVGFSFIAGTDALEGGSSGHPSSDTNFTSAAGATLTTVSIISRWDFSKGPCIIGLPALYPTDRDEALVLELEASGTGGTTGQVTAWVAAP
jgi:hypothetical protein